LSEYFGSKAASGLFQAIIAMMPPHETYIETHLGGGAIMKRKPPAVHNIGIDIDPEPLSSFNCTYPVRLIAKCAHDFLGKYNFRGNELLYCDPPYLAGTRTSRRKYRFEYTQQDHVTLLKLLKTLSCYIILSGYPSQLSDDILGDWRTIELQAMSRGGPRTEKIWFNFDVDRRFWSSYAGKNFTDRQRIKRKAERWKNKYQSLPKEERLAVMAAIMEVEGA